MLGRSFRTGLVVATVALGSGLGWAGTATASTGAGRAAAHSTARPAAAVVLSDTIKFAGVAVPNAAGNHVLTTNNCTVTSDGETPVFPCTINFTFAGNLTGTGHITGPDGVINWSYQLTPTGPNTYALNGTCATGANICYEIDSDGGTSVMYPIAAATGTVTITPIPGSPNLNVSGTVNIWEDPSQP
jgi:hypothetical protein